jgi:hypothetical protein
MPIVSSFSFLSFLHYCHLHSYYWWGVELVDDKKSIFCLYYLILLVCILYLQATWSFAKVNDHYHASAIIIVIIIIIIIIINVLMMTREQEIEKECDSKEWIYTTNKIIIIIKNDCFSLLRSRSLSKFVSYPFVTLRFSPPPSFHLSFFSRCVTSGRKG